MPFYIPFQSQPKYASLHYIWENHIQKDSIIIEPNNNTTPSKTTMLYKCNDHLSFEIRLMANMMMFHQDNPI